MGGLLVWEKPEIPSSPKHNFLSCASPNCTLKPVTSI